MNPCAMVAPTPRPPTTGPQHMHQGGNSCYKPRINMTEYTDKYIHPNKLELSKYKSSYGGGHGSKNGFKRVWKNNRTEPPYTRADPWTPTPEKMKKSVTLPPIRSSMDAPMCTCLNSNKKSQIPSPHHDRAAAFRRSCVAEDDK